MGKWIQLKLLVWKNLQIQKKHKLATIFEIGLPCLFVIILVIIRRYIHSVETCTQNPNTDYGGYCDYALFTPAMLPLIPPCEDFAHCSLNLAYTPHSAKSYMEAVKNYYGINIHGYDTEESMINFLRNNSAKKTIDNLSTYLGGVVFNLSDPQHIHYTIRLDAVPRDANHSVPPVKNWRTRWIYPVFQIIGPREINNTFGGDPGYFREGFLAIQHAIDRAIIMKETKQGHVPFPLNTSSGTQETAVHDGTFPKSIIMKRFPFPKFDLDGFIYILESTMPFLFLIAFLAMSINCVKSVVTEKEKRIKEAMKIMGLYNWVHWVAWYIEMIIVMLPPVIIITVTMKYGSIVTYSDASLIFVFLFMYMLSSIAFSFFVSSLFSRANVAAGAAGVFWFLNYTPYFFLQQFYEDMSHAQKLGVSVLSNTAMGIGAKVISTHEAAEIGVQWSTFFEDRVSGDITFGAIILMLLADTFLYITLTWYIENVFPGEFGIPKKWYFLFTPSYWGFCQSEPLADMIISARMRNFLKSSDKREEELHSPLLEEGSEMSDVTPLETIKSSTYETTPLVTASSTTAIHRDANIAYYEDVPPNMDPVVEIQNLTKTYPGKDVKAVDALNLKLYKGQIFALLGHNGAGKTTTISMLTGLYHPTKGTAYILGRDIRTNISAIRKHIGYCPQYNVLFDELTVEQHLIFFSYLKGAGTTLRFEVDKMIKALGLEDKRHECSKNLSGGMKRKLSCANALIGNSKIVFLDEPTSGMDPAARRSTWDLLLKYKSDKTIVLTTHFMDEADLLGDRIGIMAKGSLCCVGSSMFLKKHFGVGYHLTIVKNENFQPAIMNNLVTSYIEGSKMENTVAAEVSFLLPEDQMCNFDRFFNHLEREQVDLGIETYGLSITTLEEVFMRVEELDGKDANSATKVANDILTKARKTVSDTLKTDSDKLEETTSRRSRAVQIRNHFNEGRKLTTQQMKAMFIKRYYFSIRNIKTLIMQFMMPLIFTMIPLIVIKTFPTQKPAPPRNLTVLTPDNMFKESRIIYQEPDIYSPNFDSFISSLDHVTNTTLAGSAVNVANSKEHKNMTWFILDKIKKTHGQFNKDFIFGFSVLQDNKTSSQEYITEIWFNNKPYHSIPTGLNLYTNAYLHQRGSPVRVTVTNKPLPPSAIDKVNNVNNQIFAFMVAFNVLFGFAFLASSFVIFTVKERVTGARHLQMLSGLNPFVYWSSAYIWDLFNFLLPSCSLLILFQLFNVKSFSGENIPIVLLLEMLYGWAIIPLMYLLGRLFKNEVVAYTRLIMINILTGTGCVLVVFILSIPNLGLTYVNKTLKWVFIFLPNFDLGQGLGDMYLNYQIKTACTASPEARFGCLLAGIVWQDNYLAWAAPGIGRYVIWLAMLGAVFFSLVLLLEYDTINKYKNMVVPVNPRYRPGHAENDDVKLERENVAKSSLTDYAVRVESLTKLYNVKDKDLVAVDHISIGIPSKETFGLLGVNGAGKTSTFKMLTGDLPISSGTATICGYDVATDINTARKYIGYCPQFDALIDCMTAREHLMMYGRLRGIPEEALIAMVERTLNELSLLTHADYYASTLSGGNKRKLSTAIAVVGYPPVVFLDEPTSGLDVVARRSLWNVVCKVRRLGTAIILTSHSMEECEALCTRLAIMVNGQIKCIGSLQELKSKYGTGYNVQIKVQNANSGEPDKTSLYGFMRLHFPDAHLEEEHQRQLHYIIPKSRDTTWSKIFSTLERNKEQAKIQDYSVSQTTLEQVFLSFARAQREGQ